MATWQKEREHDICVCSTSSQDMDSCGQETLPDEGGAQFGPLWTKPGRQMLIKVQGARCESRIRNFG